MRICVYAISLNESLFANRFCEAAKDADLIVVADTGSTDDTVSLLEANGAIVHHIRVKPWRFDDARNACLALLPPDIDVCVSLDLDEVLQPGWREEIERVWKPETTRLRYGFDWGAGIQFSYEKIHARHGYRWTRPVHEYPVPDRITEVWADTDQLLVVHRPDSSKSRGHYLDLLKTSVAEDPYDPKNSFYLAREFSFARMWDEAIAEGNRYLALPAATWPHERCYGMRVIGRCYEELGQPDVGLSWHRRACAEAPETREPFVDLAMLCYRTSRWGECYGAAITALGITFRAKLYTVDPEVWGAKPHDLAALGAWNLGLHDAALRHAKDAVALSPDDLRLRQNVVEIEKAMGVGTRKRRRG